VQRLYQSRVLIKTRPKAQTVLEPKPHSLDWLSPLAGSQDSEFGSQLQTGVDNLVGSLGIQRLEEKIEEQPIQDLALPQL
jgi:predicted pyridoxine 5'-phosphate oxidase superfamily flavin-nucleotide-binding protein